MYRVRTSELEFLAGEKRLGKLGRTLATKEGHKNGQQCVHESGFKNRTETLCGIC
jgi:hypothetical protein